MIEFSKMCIADLDKIEDIEKCCFTIPWTRNMLLEEFANSLAHYTVIKYLGDIVGYAGMWFVCDEAHITNIAIDPKFQKRGFSKQLLSFMIEEAKDKGMVKMTLEVRRSNHSAIGLYKQFHFKNLGFRKNYYTDNQEDALILWRDLR